MSFSSVTPGLLYHDAPTAIEWLCRAFGLEKRVVVAGCDGTIIHAHLTLGGGGIMLSSAESYTATELCKSPRHVGGVGTVELIVFVPDPDAHHSRAASEGAQIIAAPEDKPYGGRGYVCRDIEGHVWAFSSYDPWATAVA